eukprot:GHVO01024114.1.p1 GENE.GHVO01024114.1~~GHVO01024114.1.p1  ORF type:complete len:448 (+),score=78.26 GHVO01024114.1:31-1374(+)
MGVCHSKSEIKETGRPVRQASVKDDAPAADTHAAAPPAAPEVPPLPSADDTARILRTVGSLEETKRRRLSVSTVGGQGAADAAASSHVMAKFETRKFDDPVSVLIDEDRGSVKRMEPQMILDLLQTDAKSVTALFGAPCQNTESSYQSKQTNWDASIRDTTATFNNLGIGLACHKGLKPESPNQDDYLALRVPGWSMYGVFDGHGPYGHIASNFVHLALPFMVLGDKEFESQPLSSMRRAFVKSHHLLEAASEQDDPILDSALSGTTATVVLHRGNKLFVSHVGDSKAIVVKSVMEGGHKKYVASDLTIDHKPILPNEKKRIESSGGEVRRLEGDIPHRVFAKNRMYPGLAMSRAIGDTIASVLGVISEPDVSEYTIEDDVEFFVLCSDGVWEFLSSQDVCDMVQVGGPAGVQAATEEICTESWERWLQEEETVVDDITAIVVWINP